MSKNIFSSWFSSEKIKNCAVDLWQCLDDMPELRNKINSVFDSVETGLEVLGFVQKDNDITDYLAGRINISQQTIFYYLSSALENTVIKCSSLEIREGCIICVLEIDKGPGGFYVTLKLGNMHLYLEEGKQLLQLDILESPEIRRRATVTAPLYFIFKKYMQYISGYQRIYKILAKNIPSLDVQENTFCLDLDKIPACRELFSREILGLTIPGFLGIDRVELKRERVRLYGGPRLPRTS